MPARLEKQILKGQEQVADRIIAKAKPRIVALPTPGGSASVGGIRRVSGPGIATGIVLPPHRALLSNVFGASRHVGRTGPRFSQAFPYTRGSGRKVPWKPWIGNAPWESTYGLGPAISEVMDRSAVKVMADRLLAAARGAFPKRS